MKVGKDVPFKISFLIIAIPNTRILPRGRSVGRRGGPPPPPNPPRTAATGQVFKIIFQDFGNYLENES